MGDYAFNNVRSCDVVRRCHGTTADTFLCDVGSGHPEVVTMAAESAKHAKSPGVVSEFARGHLENIDSFWLTGEEHVGSAETV